MLDEVVDNIFETLKERAKTRVVLFGEEHRNGVFRQIGRSLIPRLQELGFTHLAIELRDEDRSALIAYCKGLRTYQRLIKNKFSKKRSIRTLIRRTYLNMVKRGFQSGLEIIFINKKDPGRDNHMFELIDTALDGTTHRVAVWVGLGHIYVPPAGSHAARTTQYQNLAMLLDSKYECYRIAEISQLQSLNHLPVPSLIETPNDDLNHDVRRLKIGVPGVIPELPPETIFVSWNWFDAVVWCGQQVSH